MAEPDDHERRLAEAQEYAQDIGGKACEKCYAVMLFTGIEGAYWHDCDGAPTHTVLA